MNLPFKNYTFDIVSEFEIKADLLYKEALTARGFLKGHDFHLDPVWHFTICKKCNINGHDSFECDLSCDEIMIKNIIE